MNRLMADCQERIAAIVEKTPVLAPTPVITAAPSLTVRTVKPPMPALPQTTPEPSLVELQQRQEQLLIERHGQTEYTFVRERFFSARFTPLCAPEVLTEIEQLLSMRQRMKGLGERAAQKLGVQNLAAARQPIPNGEWVGLVLQVRLALNSYERQLRIQNLGNKEVQPYSVSGKIRLLEVLEELEQQGSADPAKLELSIVMGKLKESANLTDAEKIDLHWRQNYLTAALENKATKKGIASSVENLQSFFQDYYVYPDDDNTHWIVFKFPRIRGEGAEQQDQAAREFIARPTLQIPNDGTVVTYTGLVDIHGKRRNAELFAETQTTVKHMYEKRKLNRLRIEDIATWQFGCFPSRHRKMQLTVKPFNPSAREAWNTCRARTAATARLEVIVQLRQLTQKILQGQLLSYGALKDLDEFFRSVYSSDLARLPGSYAADPAFQEAYSYYQNMIEPTLRGMKQEESQIQQLLSHSPAMEVDSSAPLDKAHREAVDIFQSFQHWSTDIDKFIKMEADPRFRHVFSWYIEKLKAIQPFVAAIAQELSRIKTISQKEDAIRYVLELLLGTPSKGAAVPKAKDALPANIQFLAGAHDLLRAEGDASYRDRFLALINEWDGLPKEPNTLINGGQVGFNVAFNNITQFYSGMSVRLENMIKYLGLYSELGQLASKALQRVREEILKHENARVLGRHDGKGANYFPNGEIFPVLNKSLFSRLFRS
ncbi:MAG: hypothetical protein HY069_04755 [Chlamydiia bacterium]|nr:hypothetical protein [Chlamydiia bacterium]